MIRILSLIKTPWFPYVVGTLAFSLLMYMTSLRVQVLRLEKEILTLEQALGQSEFQNSELVDSLKYQGQKIRVLEQFGDAKKAETESLLLRLNKESKERTELVRKLKSSEAKTCEQGVQLINEALGL